MRRLPSQKLSADVGIPADLKGHPQGGRMFSSWPRSAFADACCPATPRGTSVEEIKELYRSLM